MILEKGSGRRPFYDRVLMVTQVSVDLFDLGGPVVDRISVGFMSTFEVLPIKNQDISHRAIVLGFFVQTTLRAACEFGSSPPKRGLNSLFYCRSVNCCSQLRLGKWGVFHAALHMQ